MTQQHAGGGPNSFAGALLQHQQQQAALTASNQSFTVGNTGGILPSGGTTTGNITISDPDWAMYQPALTRSERELSFLLAFIKEKEEIVWRKVYEAKWVGKPKPKKAVENLEDLYRMVETLENEVRREKDTP